MVGVSKDQRLSAAMTVLGTAVVQDKISVAGSSRKPKNRPQKPPQKKPATLYEPRSSSLKKDYMGIDEELVTNPAFNVISKINQQFLLNEQHKSLSDSQKTSIRDLILRSMGFTSRPRQNSPISEDALKAHHQRMMNSEPTHLAQEAKLGLISPFLEYLLDDGSRFNTETLIGLKQMRDFLLGKNSAQQ
jgi:hypothetical protein